MASRGKALILTTAALVAVLGCGARTDTLFDDGSGGSSFGAYGAGGQAHGGGYPTAGTQGRGGNSSGGYATAGSFGVGGQGVGGGYTAGNFGVGGSFGTSGSFGTAGSFGTSGSFGTGGAVSTGGTGPLGGSFGTGGFGAVGGDAGAGGSGGIVDICVSSAQTACNKCLCQSCGTDLNTCFSDLGCVLIFACIQQKQCQGFGCYQNSACKSVIDQFGGLTGAPVNEVFSLASCSVTARTSCGCK
jgi:hypothetical protein